MSMNLGTFGAILKFALETESNVGKFYSSLSSMAFSETLTKISASFAVRSQNRITTLERIRRENTTEMILEPIVGLDSEKYTPSTRVPEGANEATIKGIAQDIERKLYDFYGIAAKKIEFLSEAAYAFELLAEKNEDALKQLLQ
jgi:rubrerythrin